MATSHATNPVSHSRTKHIEIYIHYIRDKVRNGQLKFRYAPSLDQIADIFTKPLSFNKFHFFRRKLQGLPKTCRLRGHVKDAS